jgi:hypothetical protein
MVAAVVMVLVACLLGPFCRCSSSVVVLVVANINLKTLVTQKKNEKKKYLRPKRRRRLLDPFFGLRGRIVH